VLRAVRTTAAVRRARAADLRVIEQMLSAAQLPLEGAAAAFERGFVAADDDRVVGAAALECYEDGALLRSVVVDPSARGQGLGMRLTMAGLEEARSLALPAVYLLTTTAEEFFLKLGFVRISRADVPASLLGSAEFQSACPATASLLVLRFPPFYKLLT
jgi:amino-acid N-acetyltransferase